MRSVTLLGEEDQKLCVWDLPGLALEASSLLLDGARTVSIIALRESVSPEEGS